MPWISADPVAGSVETEPARFGGRETPSAFEPDPLDKFAVRRSTGIIQQRGHPAVVVDSVRLAVGRLAQRGGILWRDAY